MANPSKQKGSAYETSLLPVLQSFYPGAKRNPLAGLHDVGDFYLPTEKRLVLEAKNRTVMALPAWVKQAQTSARNLNPQAVGVVIHKRKGCALPGRQWVTMELADFLYLINQLSEPAV